MVKIDASEYETNWLTDSPEKESQPNAPEKGTESDSTPTEENQTEQAAKALASALDKTISKEWIPYEGPRGGEGWQNTEDKKDIRYTEDPPGEIANGYEEMAEDWGNENETESDMSLEEMAEKLSNIELKERQRIEPRAEQAIEFIESGVDPETVLEAYDESLPAMAGMAGHSAVGDILESISSPVDLEYQYYDPPKQSEMTFLHNGTNGFDIKAKKAILNECDWDGGNDPFMSLSVGWRKEMFRESTAPIFQEAKRITGNETIPEIAEQHEHDAVRPFEVDVPQQERELVEATSKITTKLFREAFGDTIPVYRGLSPVQPPTAAEPSDLSDRLKEAAKNGESVEINHRTAESWTTNPQYASKYAEGEPETEPSMFDVEEPDPQPGVVIKREIPVERIVVSSQTGILASGESEVVIAHEESRTYSPDEIVPYSEIDTEFYGNEIRRIVSEQSKTKAKQSSPTLEIPASVTNPQWLRSITDSERVRKNWIPYEGPMGGEGWQNTNDPDDVRYTDEAPGEIADGYEEQAEGWGDDNDVEELSGEQIEVTEGKPNKYTHNIQNVSIGDKIAIGNGDTRREGIIVEHESDSVEILWNNGESATLSDTFFSRGNRAIYTNSDDANGVTVDSIIENINLSDTSYSGNSIHLSLESSDQLKNELKVLNTDGAQSLIAKQESWKESSYSDTAQSRERVFMRALDIGGKPRNGSLNGEKPTQDEVEVAKAIQKISEKFAKKHLINEDREIEVYRGVSSGTGIDLKEKIFASYGDAVQSSIEVEMNPMTNYSTKRSVAETWGEDTAVIEQYRNPGSIITATDLVMAPSREAEISMVGNEQSLTTDQLWIENEWTPNQIFGEIESVDVALDVFETAESLLDKYKVYREDNEESGDFKPNQETIEGIKRFAKDAKKEFDDSTVFSRSNILLRKSENLLSEKEASISKEAEIKINLAENPKDIDWIAESRKNSVVSKQWMPYLGPDDGEGWQNANDPDDIRYVEDAPGEVHEDYQDMAEDWGESSSNEFGGVNFSRSNEHGVIPEEEQEKLKNHLAEKHGEDVANDFYDNYGWLNEWKAHRETEEGVKLGVAMARALGLDEENVKSYDKIDPESVTDAHVQMASDLHEASRVWFREKFGDEAPMNRGFKDGGIRMLESLFSDDSDSVELKGNEMDNWSWKMDVPIEWGRHRSDDLGAIVRTERNIDDVIFTIDGIAADYTTHHDSAVTFDGESEVSKENVSIEASGAIKAYDEDGSWDYDWKRSKGSFFPFRPLEKQDMDALKAVVLELDETVFVNFSDDEATDKLADRLREVRDYLQEQDVDEQILEAADGAVENAERHW